MGHTSMDEKLRRLELGGLVARAQKDDRKALEEIIEITQNNLYRFCLYLTGDKTNAEDLCQNAYVKILTKIKTIKEPEKFFSWLLKTAKNLYLDFLRNSQIRETAPLDDTGVDLKDDKGGQTDLIVQIHESLLVLRPQDRLIILLVDHSGYSYKEAAEIIGVSQEALTSRIHRIRKDFLKKFDGS